MALRAGCASALAAMLLMLTASLAMSMAFSAPLEVYGRLPSPEEVALSPDGARLAFVHTWGNDRILEVVDLASRKVMSGMRLNTAKLRSIEWTDTDHLLIVISVTALPFDLADPVREWYLLQLYDVVTSKAVAIPDAQRLGPNSPRIMNVVWGDIMVRRVEGHTVLFVPGYYAADEILPALFKVDLQTGAEKIVREGSRSTHAWLVDEDREVATEENYSAKEQRWWILQRRDGRMHEIASGHEPIDYPKLLGFGPQAGTLLMETKENGDPVWRLLSMQDGSFGAPMAAREVMEAPIEDTQTHRMIGGIHVDDAPHYVFFDPQTQAKWDSIVRAVGKDQVSFVSRSDDFKKIIVQVNGPEFGYAYEFVDMTTHRAEPVGDVYDGVTRPPEVRRITYKAADGLEIPAYLTLARDRPEKNLPLVLLAHGGPAARDTARFDWWAQALADQGYLVLQPNYRGSDIKQQFMEAGFGEWGRKMQTDLSDGVRYLVKEGVVDPARVCIVGTSYGGYAALAGVTLDPSVYRCAVPVAGIKSTEWSMVH